jgi:hypothetical protein
VSSTRGIKLQPNTAYRLHSGDALVWVEEIRPFPSGPMGVILPEQPNPEAYVIGIPGSTRKRPLGCFASGDVAELSPFNKKFVADLPALRAAKVENVHPPKTTAAAPGRRPAARGADTKRYQFVKPNPKFKPGTQSGLVQSALQSLDKPTKQEIADACTKMPEWKWTADAAFKGARWYVDVLVREGHAKEIA